MTFKEAIDNAITKATRVAAKNLEIAFVGTFTCIELHSDWGYDVDLGLLHIPCNYAKAASKMAAVLAGFDYCSKCNIEVPKAITTKYKFLKESQ